MTYSCAVTTATVWYCLWSLTIYFPITSFRAESYDGNETPLMRDFTRWKTNHLYAICSFMRVLQLFNARISFKK